MENMEFSPPPPPPPSPPQTNQLYPELPTKMIIEPLPQTSEQSIEDYIHYYDTIVSTNIWDDCQAALYLPRFITDERYLNFIRQLSPGQQQSYRWLRQIILDTAYYQHQQPNALFPSGHDYQQRSLSQIYWSKLGDLRSHVRRDLRHFSRELHGLVGETCHHLGQNYVNQDCVKMIKNVVPTRVEKTVSGVFQRLTSGRLAPYERSSWSPSEKPTAPPSYQDIFGDKK